VTETRIIDIDTHLTDAAPDMWAPYFTAAESGLVPRVVEHEGTRRLLVGDMLLPKPSGPGIGSPLGIGATTHVASLAERLSFIEQLNIEHSFLLPGFVGLAAHTVADRDARRVLARAHNDLLHDLTAGIKQIEFAPVVLPDDPEWSIGHLRRYRDRAHLYGVVSRPTTADTRPYRAGLDNSLLSYLRDEGIVLMLHGATGYHQRSPIADEFDDYRFTHVFSHPFEQMVALTDLLGSGAMSDGLRVAIVEAGCGWFPWFLGRLQEHFDHTGGCSRVPVRAAEVAAQQMLLGVTPDDEGIAGMVEAGFAGILAFGSDFPHWDAVPPESVDELRARQSPQIAERILYRNAHEFFGW
jgi:hypothetical protein